MEGTINIPVPFQVFLDLSSFLDGRRINEEMADVAGKAITAWIEQHSKPQPEAVPVLLGGYQWKHVFLPAGTKLRIVVSRKTFHAEVAGDHIMYNGAATSPARLVNHLSASRRNAWKHIWVLMPGETRWQLAQSLRE